MRKATRLMMTFLLIAAGVLSANARVIDLDPAMFKAWDGFEPGANVVADPAECPNSDGSTSPFGCEYHLYDQVGAGAVIYGNTNVYYLWYADITGTNTINIEGTPGMQLRFLMNRPAPEEGGDVHGGTTVERTVTLDADGNGSIDVSDLEYVHINAVKSGWGSPTGTITKLEIDGTVKPVTGWLDQIDNGDLEGTDNHNFFVALDAVNDPNYYPAEIIDGVGVDGSRGIKVTSIDNPTETWATQFFVKFNQELPNGKKWRIAMDYRASADAASGTGVHGEPRAWKGGGLFDGLDFTTEWKHFTAEGTISMDGILSIAFDLNNSAVATDYFFDNIEFQLWEEPVGIKMVGATFYQDAIRVNFGYETNIAALVKAAGGTRVVFPNDIVKVVVNGEAATIMSVEGRPDGNLYIFIDEGYPENDDDVVEVSFTNPEGEQQVIYTKGKNADEPVPSFINVKATAASEDDDLTSGDYFSYLYGTPAIASADPEDGSFNLDKNLTEFVVTFDHEVDCAALVAKLDNEKLTVAPAEGFALTVKLTRAAGELTGEHTLYISNVKGEKDLGDVGEYELALSFGPVNIDPDQQPRELIEDTFADTANGGIPVGYVVNFNNEERTSDNTYGSGPRLFDFSNGVDFKKALYFREGYVDYGVLEDYMLDLTANSKYVISFYSSMWKDNGQWMKFEVLDENDEPVVSEMVKNAPNVNGDQGNAVSGATLTTVKFVPEFDGYYRLRWTASDADGNQAYSEVLLANPHVKYVPSTMGAEELTNLTVSLDNAKSVRDANADERYAGEAFTALSNTIAKYEGVTFTAPSKVAKAIEELDAAAKAMTDHRTLCDTYDPLPAEAQAKVDNWAESKFVRHEIYAKLKAAAEKYADKVLTNDDELKVAISELQDNINLANEMFTEGPSAVGDWSATRTGVAPLVERIRVGAEALKSLGVEEDAEIIVAADNALTDDDRLVKSLKQAVKEQLYGQLQDPNNTVFEGVVNEETLEEETPSYDMTVFVKNPNLYKISDGNGHTEGAVPGWDVTDGRGFSTGWNAYGSAQVPVDAMFSNWGGSFLVSQTVTDLPAGVYTVKGGYGERMGEDEAADALDNTFFFAMNSEEIDDTLGHTVPAPRIGQSFPSIETCIIEDVVVTDGILTLGVQAGQASHVFFDAVKVFITGAAEGYDYKQAYLDGVETLAVQPKHVRAIEIYDLNGRRLGKSGKGLVLVKKFMSDGTIRTEKVVK